MYACFGPKGVSFFVREVPPQLLLLLREVYVLPQPLSRARRLVRPCHRLPLSYKTPIIVASSAPVWYDKKALITKPSVQRALGVGDAVLNSFQDKLEG